MKTLTIINWVFSGLYGALLIFSFLRLSRPGNDAAGRGMESGLLVLGIVVLGAFMGLNRLPYLWSKLTALLLQGLPLLIGLYNLAANYFEKEN